MNVTSEFAVSISMRLYHTTSARFVSFANKPTWFTPCLEQAAGYRAQSAASYTSACDWFHGSVATTKDAAPYMLQVWPDCEETEPMYSMFDENIGEWEVNDVRRFIKLLTDAGFVAATHRDYSSLNSDEDAYTLVAFNPNECIQIKGIYEA